MKQRNVNPRHSVKWTMHTKKGMAMVVVVSVFMIITIILASVAFSFQNNLSQAHRQEERMKAYYLALSGIELGYSALIKNMASDPNATPIYFFTQALPLTSSQPKVQDVALDGGSVTITATRISLDGDDWIQISATGTTDTAAVRSTTMRFLVDNPAFVSRENN